MVRRGSPHPIIIPLYATYLFADVDRGPPWQAIRRQPGVVSIVMTGDAPSRCPESEIAKLKAFEVHGLVQLAGEPSPSAQKSAIGEKVKIRYGALDGREALYAGEADKRRKAHVLVCLLGPPASVLLAGILGRVWGVSGDRLGRPCPTSARIPDERRKRIARQARAP